MLLKEDLVTILIPVVSGRPVSKSISLVGLNIAIALSVLAIEVLARALSRPNLLGLGKEANNKKNGDKQESFHVIEMIIE